MDKTSVKSMTSIALLGGTGRMGAALAEASAELTDLCISARLGRRGDLDTAVFNCDVLVDFSVPESSLLGMEVAVKHRKPCVIGTTAFTPDQERQIAEYARTIPIVKSANFSLGIALLIDLCKRATVVLGNSYDIEILESHHRNKRDAPSGTALMIATELAYASGLQMPDAVNYGRGPTSQPRKVGDIGIHSIRAGNLFGEHLVLFAGTGEQLEIVHKAGSRICYAMGALKSAVWVRDKAPGFYHFGDVLGLEAASH